MKCTKTIEISENFYIKMSNNKYMSKYNHIEWGDNWDLSTRYTLTLNNYNEYLKENAHNHTLFELEYIVKFFKDVLVDSVYDGVDL